MEEKEEVEKGLDVVDSENIKNIESGEVTKKWNRLIVGLATACVFISATSCIYLNIVNVDDITNSRVVDSSKVAVINDKSLGEIKYATIQLVEGYNLINNMAGGLYDNWIAGLEEDSENVNTKILELMYLWKNSDYDQILADITSRVDYMKLALDLDSEVGKSYSLLSDIYEELCDLVTRPSGDIKSHYSRLSKLRESFTETYSDIVVYLGGVDIVDVDCTDMEIVEFEYASGVSSEDAPTGGLCMLDFGVKHTVEHLDIQLSFMNRAYEEIKEGIQKNKINSVSDITDFMEIAYDSWWSGCSKSGRANSIKSNGELIELLIEKSSEHVNDEGHSILKSSYNNILKLETGLNIDIGSIDKFIKEVGDNINICVEDMTNMYKLFIVEN